MTEETKPPYVDGGMAVVIVWFLLILGVGVIAIAMANIAPDPIYAYGSQPTLADVVDKRAAQIVEALRVVAVLLGICSFAGLKILFYKWPRV